MFSVSFKFLDILGVYSLLLGRPWIHAARAVSSILHQKVKFIYEDRLVMIDWEEDYNVYEESSVPFIGIETEDALSFHVFDLIYVIRDWGEPAPDRAELMSGKIMLGNNFILGRGLGIHGQGIIHPIAPRKNKGTFRLGFHHNFKDYEVDRRKRVTGNSRVLLFPPLAVLFPGLPQMIQPNEVAAHERLSYLFSIGATIGALLDEAPSCIFVRPLASGENITNWMTLPAHVFSLSNNE